MTKLTKPGDLLRSEFPFRDELIANISEDELANFAEDAGTDLLKILHQLGLDEGFVYSCNGHADARKVYFEIKTPNAEESVISLLNFVEDCATSGFEQSLVKWGLDETNVPNPLSWKFTTCVASEPVRVL